MSTDISSIHELAVRLANGTEEADWRSASSRAYYAGYHRAMLSANHCPDNSNQKMGSHERLSDRFSLHNSVGARSIAYVLIGMKKQRHVADYEIDGHFFQSYAKGQVATFGALNEKLVSFDDLNQAKTA